MRPNLSEPLETIHQRYDHMVINIDIWSKYWYDASMRYHQPLDGILGNKTQVRILRLLCRTQSAHTGRELARLIELSHNTVRSALEELERNGLVIKQQAGRSYMYSLDEDNIITTDILSPAFKLENDLLKKVVGLYFDALGKDLVKAIIFGSVSKGNERPESDIDLVLVFKNGINPEDKEDSVAEVSLEVARKFGNQASAILVKESDYKASMKAKKGLWKEIKETGVTIEP